jgi:hypothetical protein
MIFTIRYCHWGCVRYLGQINYRTCPKDITDEIQIVGSPTKNFSVHIRNCETVFPSLQRTIMKTIEHPPLLNNDKQTYLFRRYRSRSWIDNGGSAAAIANPLAGTPLHRSEVPIAGCTRWNMLSPIHDPKYFSS